MITPQFSLDLNTELIVDNFAGGGGASTGIELALGRHVDHAINHDRHALGMHRINHPQSVHHCEDVFDIDPATVCEGRPVGLAHFSPDCTDFSKAKGGQPIRKHIRGLVLVMLRWAKYGARVMTMENVEEITTWGPLIEIRKNGKLEWHRDPAHKGRTWKAFLACLSTGIDPDHPDLPEILEVLAGTVTKEELARGFGYACEAREIRACDHGTPTIRKRLFMVARRDGRPIVFPAASHFNPKLKEAWRRGYKPYRTIAECIDWDRPCPSIFLRGDEARKARCKRPLKESTLWRLARGVDRYVLQTDEPFLISVTHQGSDRVEPTGEPARTITGANRGEKALAVARYHGDHAGRGDGAGRNVPVTQPLGAQDASNRFSLTEASLAPFVTECANASTQRNMPANEPARTVCGEVKGGHFALGSAHLLTNTTGHSGGAANAPSSTITTGEQQVLVTGALVGAGGRAGQSRPRGVGEPVHTCTAKADTCLASATLVHTAHGEQDCNGKKRGRGAREITEPMPSVLGSSDGALAAVHLTKFNTGSVGQDVREPVSTIRAGSHSPDTHGSAASPHGMIAASLLTLEGGATTHAPGQPAGEPLRTVLANGNHHYLSATYLAQHNGGFNETPGHPATEPVSTIGAKGSQQQLVAASAVAYYGSEQDGQGMDEATRTATTKPRLGLVESFIACSMTPDQVEGALRVAAFLREYGVQLEGDFAVTRTGHVIVDLGMRMLTPRELFRAQGFPDSYIIDRAWLVNPKTGGVQVVALTKEQQIRMCGNSVCAQPYRDIVLANVPELAVWSQRNHKRALSRTEVRAC